MEPLFGKYSSELQSDIQIASNNVISGTLNYVDGYTGFSSDPELQEGHDLALHVDTGDVTGATITVTVTNPSVLDEDQTIVLYIRDKDSQTVTVVAEKEDYPTVRKVYRRTGLTLAPEGQG